MSRITKHALSVYSMKFRETRPDLANKAVHDMIHHLAGYEGRNGAKFSTWAHQIIVNVGRKEITKKIMDRKYWNQLDDTIPEDSDWGEDWGFPSETEEDKAHARIFLEKVRDSLSGEDKTLFDMTLEGRSAAEMGQVLGGTESSVRSRKMRLASRDPFVLAKQQEINNLNFKPRNTILFSQFAVNWVERVLSQHKPSTQVATKSHLKIHLNPYFGDLQLQQVNGERIQDFIASRKISPKSIHNLVATMRMLWNSAKAWQYVSHDPFEGLVLPSAPDPEPKFFTLEEVQRILDAAPEPSRTFYCLAAETGLRAGELCGLRWEDIHLETGVIAVRQSAWQGRIVTPKTKKASRTFSISPQLLEHLRKMRGTGLIFTYSNGRPWKGEKVVERKLKPLLKKLGIAHRGLHAFRHTNATIMDRLGVPMKTRQDRLGHADSRMTLGRYTHVVSEDDKKIAAQFGGLLWPIASKTQNAEALSFGS